jgi:hypothetical protein
LVVELLAVTYGSLRLGMDLLMTEQVNQCQIAVGIFAPLRPCQEVVNVKFFVVEERFPTFQATTFLSFGELLCARTSGLWLSLPAV